MKMSVRRLLSCVLVFLLVVSIFALPVSATETTDLTAVFSSEDGSYNVSLWKSEFDDKYYAFLPSDADLSELVVDFSTEVKIDGQKIINNEATDAFSKGGLFKVETANKSFDLVVLKSGSIPTLYIETESGSLEAVHADKNHKEPATIKVVENGKTTINTSLSYIKGRGNSTWQWDKRPYNIKFEKKTDLFGMGKAKKWSLLANYIDETNIRNNIALGLADKIGLYYSSKNQNVDLYINGIYEGNYLLCESVEVGSTRVDITDLEEANEKANPDINIEECELDGVRGENSGYTHGSKKWVNIPNNPENISGGYLLEFELAFRYDEEVSGFISSVGQPVVFKSPEYATKSEVEYISSFYQEFEDALYSKNGYNSAGKHYSDYIDVESFVRAYLLQEFVMNLDAGTTSFYILKDADSDKLVASPVWDFDHSLGEKYERYGIDFSNPNVWWVRNEYMTDTRAKTQKNDSYYSVLATLCKHDDFMSLVKSEWKNNFKTYLGENIKDSISKLAAENRASAIMDACRWNRFKTAGFDKKGENFDYFINKLYAFVESREKSLDKGFGENAAFLRYNANGGKGIMFCEDILSLNDFSTVKECTYEGADFCDEFVGWCTSPDGNGKTYKPGDFIQLKKSDVTLFAQWKRVSLLRAYLTRIVKTFKLIIEAFRSAFSQAFVDVNKK